MNFETVKKEEGRLAVASSSSSATNDQNDLLEFDRRAYRYAESLYWQNPAETKFYFFHLRENGVFLVDKRERNPSIWVCSHLKVIAQVRDDRSENWGRLVSFKDDDGIVHEAVLSNSELIGHSDAVGKILVSSGLKMPPGRKALILLLRYLTESSPKERLLYGSEKGESYECG
jgi:hypothetical protein